MPEQRTTQQVLAELRGCRALVPQLEAELIRLLEYEGANAYAAIVWDPYTPRDPLIVPVSEHAHTHVRGADGNPMLELWMEDGQVRYRTHSIYPLNSVMLTDRSLAQYALDNEYRFLFGIAPTRAEAEAWAQTVMTRFPEQMAQDAELWGMSGGFMGSPWWNCPFPPPNERPLNRRKT